MIVVSRRIAEATAIEMGEYVALALERFLREDHADETFQLSTPAFDNLAAAIRGRMELMLSNLAVPE